MCRTCNLKEPTTWQQPQKSAFVFDAVHFKFFSPFLFLWATTKIGAKRYVVACYYLVKQWSKSLFKVYFDSCVIGISSTDFDMTKFECRMSNIDFLEYCFICWSNWKNQTWSINTSKFPLLKNILTFALRIYSICLVLSDLYFDSIKEYFRSSNKLTCCLLKITQSSKQIKVSLILQSMFRSFFGRQRFIDL